MVIFAGPGEGTQESGELEIVGGDNSSVKR
jgi:hypothetical protein